MAYLVDPHTVYRGLKAVGLEQDAQILKGLLEGILEAGALKLARAAGFEIGTAHLEEAELGGLLVMAKPRKGGDPIPEVLKGADHYEEWGGT